MRRLAAITPWLVILAVLAMLAGFGLGTDSAAFAGSLFAAATTFVAILVFEALMRPTIDFQIERPTEVQPSGRAFLRVFVWNRAMLTPLRPFVDRRPALLARAWITFLNEANQPIFKPGHRMRGRWSVTPEPVRAISIRGDEGEPRVALFWDPSATTDTVDIAPGSFQILDVVARAPGQDICFGWHNGIIQRPDPPVDARFELTPGRYHALIRVETGGRRFRYVVRIVNDVPLEHFRQESLDSQPKLPAEL